jgi:hypothetical protein
MPKPLESVIEHMERLKAELLAAEMNLEEINREADLCLKWMRDEIAALEGKIHNSNRAASSERVSSR